MPAALPIIIAAASAAGSYVFLGATLYASVGLFALQVGLGVVGNVFAAKPKPPDESFDASAAIRTEELRQTAGARVLVCGKVRVSGQVAMFATSADNEFLHIIIVLASHQVQEIGTVYLDDVPVYTDQLDGSGNVTTGAYAGKVRIKKHLGTDSQTADSDAVAEIAGWTTAHRLQGLAYIYLRYDADLNVFPNGKPNASAEVKGALYYDPRTSTTSWQPNPGLMAYWYLTNTRYGRAVDASRMAVDSYSATANICDEFVNVKALANIASSVDATANAIYCSVDTNLPLNPYQDGDRVQCTTNGTLPGGLSLLTNYYVIVYKERDSAANKLATSYANALAGVAIDLTSAGTGQLTLTKNGEPRYTANGTVDTSRNIQDILTDMAGSCAGRIVDPAGAGGSWYMVAGAWVSPTVTLDDNHVIGAVQTQTKQTADALYNAVQGVYASPQNYGQPSSYPLVADAGYLAEDNGEQVISQLDLPFTSRSQTAQRIARIELNRARRQVTSQATFTLHGMQVMASDYMGFTFAPRGWAAKGFEVAGHKLSTTQQDDGAQLLQVDMTLREADADMFNFDETTDETQSIPAPRPTVPDPFNIPAPTSLALDTGTATLYLRADGTVTSRIHVGWVASTGIFIDRYEIQAKPSGDVIWQPSIYVPHDTLEGYIWDAQDGVMYDVRVRAVNTLGARSAWLQDSVVVVGKTAPPGDVPYVTANQNGDSGVVIRWGQVLDVDLKTYEIRYMAAPFNWGAAAPIESGGLSQASKATTFSLPVGTWVVGIKAIDTSGNYSTTEAITGVTVSSSTNATIFSLQQAPDWLGILTHVVHNQVSGKLVMESTDTDSTADDIFDSFVPRPNAVGTYELPMPEDLGSDKTGVQIFTEVAVGLGPLETGAAMYTTQYDYKTSAGAYHGYADFTVQSVDGRYIKGQITITSASGVPFVSTFTFLGATTTHRESETGVTVPIGGYPVVFAQPFFSVPHIDLTSTGPVARIPVITAGPTTTGFTFQLHDGSDTDLGGLANWAAVGP